jgi:porcupine-like protein
LNQTVSDVFKPSKSVGLGGFPAVILTYCASALLHGLNAQLWSVLLSLGFCTYAEHVLRARLSSIYDGCIASRACDKPKACDHKKTRRTVTCVAWNVGFSALAVISLAYLGVMFDADPKLQEQGYDFAHTFAKWFHLNFAGHWIAISMLVMYYML